MRLTGLTLQHFRNIELAKLELRGGRHFLLGANGQGKTNLLEAVGFVTALRSFRAADHRLLIQRGQMEAAASFQFAHEETGETTVQIRLQAGQRTVTVDGEKMERLADFIGRFPTVVFSSDDIHLVRGAPAGRRRWMDLVLAATDPEYFRVLQRFHQALKTRNSLFKQRGTAGEFGSFEAAMAPLALQLFRFRQTGLASFATYFQSHYTEIVAGAEEGSISFEPDLPLETEDEFRKHWAEARPRETLQGTTQRGPHRDDLVFTVKRRPAKDFGSEGQQRALVLALRLAQVDYFRQRLKLAPVLLADDIVNELDPRRRACFWSAIGPELQLFATGTAPPPDEGWQIFSVREGAFSETRE